MRKRQPKQELIRRPESGTPAVHAEAPVTLRQRLSALPWFNKLSVRSWRSRSEVLDAVTDFQRSWEENIASGQKLADVGIRCATEHEHRLAAFEEERNRRAQAARTAAELERENARQGELNQLDHRVHCARKERELADEQGDHYSREERRLSKARERESAMLDDHYARQDMYTEKLNDRLKEIEEKLHRGIISRKCYKQWKKQVIKKFEERCYEEK